MKTINRVGENSRKICSDCDIREMSAERLQENMFSYVAFVECIFLSRFAFVYGFCSHM